MRYDDDDDLSCTVHTFVCCFVDIRRRAYTSKELDNIPIPAKFARVPERVKTSSDLLRVFAQNAMIFSFDSNGQSRITNDAVIR